MAVAREVAREEVRAAEMEEATVAARAEAEMEEAMGVAMAVVLVAEVANSRFVVLSTKLLLLLLRCCQAQPRAASRHARDAAYLRRCQRLERRGRRRGGRTRIFWRCVARPRCVVR